MKKFFIILLVLAILFVAQLAYVGHKINVHSASNDINNISEALRLRAEQGDASAQDNLGLLYSEGKAVPKDEAEAAKWFLKAAEQGNLDAENNLGNAYSQGQGVAQDGTKAADWWYKSAMQGNEHSQFNLGVAYARGVGVQKNYDVAYMWLALATVQGNKKANEALEYIKKSMTPAQIAEGEKYFHEMQPKITKN